MVLAGWFETARNILPFIPRSHANATAKKICSLHDHTSLAFKSDRPTGTHKIAGKKGPPTYVLHGDKELRLVVVLAELLLRQTRLE